LGLIKTLERSGCYVVDDDLVQAHHFIPDDIPAEGDPLDNLVRSFLENETESPTRYIDDGVKGRDLVRRVKRSRAEGVLFCAPSFCDPALLDQPMAVRAIERADIPWTSFKYAENNGQFQVIREQAGTFADSIKLWSEV
jgi:benzoyl-CoA reductase subunit C